MLSIALNLFGNALQLKKDEASDLLRSRIRIVHLEENQKIYQQGSIEGAALVMVTY